MEISATIQTENEELLQLRGKQIQLKREKEKINNHREVFLVELARLEKELVTVDGKLDEITKQCYQSQRRITWLYFQRLLQILYNCFFCLYTLLSFILINVSYMVYVTLVVAAKLARAILDFQTNISVTPTNRGKLEESYCWN